MVLKLPPGKSRVFQLRESYPVTNPCCISSKDVRQGFIKSLVPKDFWTNWVGNMYESKFGTRIDSLVVFFWSGFFVMGLEKRWLMFFFKFTNL